MIPTGYLSDGCYDELGARYVIPEYCYAATIVREDDQEDEQNADGALDTATQIDNHHDSNQSDSRPTSAGSVQVILRLSNNSNDVILRDCDLQTTTIKHLRDRLLAERPELQESERMRFVHLGKIHQETAILGQILAGGKHGQKVIIQVML